jgi:hypothetical protein
MYVHVPKRKLCIWKTYEVELESTLQRIYLQFGVIYAFSMNM